MSKLTEFLTGKARPQNIIEQTELAAAEASLDYENAFVDIITGQCPPEWGDTVASRIAAWEIQLGRPLQPDEYQKLQELMGSYLSDDINR